jgi:DNA-directed RNA polymerase specialized sigma24 family protein
MQVDQELLERARKEQSGAVIEVLSMHYPAVYRMAYAISGRRDVGDGVVRFVMRRSFRALPHWKDEEAPQRWFRHHTILTVRRAARHPPDSVEIDTLIPPEALEADPKYPAFVRALRGLPQQQREAFLLHHGEKLDLRGISVAMDCSTVAAAQHLGAANDELLELVDRDFQKLASEVAENYAKLAPSSDLALSQVSTGARRYLWPRKLARFLGSALLVLAMFALAYAGVKWWREIGAWFKEVISH